MIWDNRNFKFQSTLPLRGATKPQGDSPARIDISIHAPLTGSDQALTLQDIKNMISIHAPLTGSDSKTAQNFT